VQKSRYYNYSHVPVLSHIHVCIYVGRLCRCVYRYAWSICWKSGTPTTVDLWTDFFRRYVSDAMLNLVAANSPPYRTVADLRKKLTRRADLTRHPIHGLVCTGNAVACRLIFRAFVRTVECSRVVSVLDSGAEGPWFKSQPRRCRVTVLGKLFTPIVPLFTKQQNW